MKRDETSERLWPQDSEKKNFEISRLKTRFAREMTEIYQKVPRGLRVSIVSLGSDISYHKSAFWSIRIQHDFCLAWNGEQRWNEIGKHFCARESEDLKNPSCETGYL
jgi:hypothetical protein